MSQIPHPFNSYLDPAESSANRETSLAVGRFFNSVYAWMTAGLALTALVAWYVAQHPVILQNLGQGGMIGIFIAELVLVGVISAAVRRINTGVATLLFLAFAALNGLGLSVLLIVYPHAVLANAFAIAAGMFGAMSIYGFVTRKDLSGWGSLLFMALIGLIIASVVSMFFYSSALNTLINFAGVFIFIGLTAYDTQMLKQLAIATQGNVAYASRLSISGALTLYLDFLNLFIFLVRIMGDRK